MNGNAVNAAQMLGIFGTVFGRHPIPLLAPSLALYRTATAAAPSCCSRTLDLGLDYLLMAWAPVLGWLFVGRVISGLTASSVPTAMAYMADVTPVEKRASAFGLLGAAFGMGFVSVPPSEACSAASTRVFHSWSLEHSACSMACTASSFFRNR